MKNHTKILIWTSIALAVISILWYGYNYYLYSDFQQWLKMPEGFTPPVNFIFYGLYVSYISHFVILLSVVLTFKNPKSLLISGVILLMFGSCSFFISLFHWLVLCDIVHEYVGGYETDPELKGLRIIQLLQASFFLFSAVYFFILNKFEKKIKSTPGIRGEHLFTALNIVGMVCGLLGLLVVYSYSTLHIRHLYRWEMIPYAFVLLPYLIMLSGWIIRSFKDKRSGVYDEKQKIDIYKAGFITLMITMPLVILLLIFGFLQKIPGKSDLYSLGTIDVLWLPFYLFLVLIMFSAISLYNYRKN